MKRKKPLTFGRPAEHGGFIDRPATSRCSPDSAIVKRNEMLEKLRGPFFRQGLPWPRWEKDLAYTGWLVRYWCPTSLDLAIPSFQSEMGRTFDGIFTMLRKLSTRILEYRPLGRDDLTGSPWIDRAVWLLSLTENETGRRNGANEIEYQHRVLCRSEREIKEKKEELLSRWEREGFCLDIPKLTTHKVPQGKKSDSERLSIILEKILENCHELQSHLKEGRKKNADKG